MMKFKKQIIVSIKNYLSLVYRLGSSKNRKCQVCSLDGRFSCDAKTFFIFYRIEPYKHYKKRLTFIILIYYLNAIIIFLTHIHLFFLLTNKTIDLPPHKGPQ